MSPADMDRLDAAILYTLHPFVRVKAYQTLGLVSHETSI
jgi:hypothetical protein